MTLLIKDAGWIKSTTISQIITSALEYISLLAAGHVFSSRETSFQRNQCCILQRQTTFCLLYPLCICLCWSYELLLIIVCCIPLNQLNALLSLLEESNMTDTWTEESNNALTIQWYTDNFSKVSSKSGKVCSLFYTAHTSIHNINIFTFFVFPTFPFKSQRFEIN